MECPSKEQKTNSYIDFLNYCLELMSPEMIHKVIQHNKIQCLSLHVEKRFLNRSLIADEGLGN